MANTDDCDACKRVGVELFHNDELGLALCEHCDDLMNDGGAARRLVIFAATGEYELPKLDPLTRAFGSDGYSNHNPYYDPAKCGLLNVVTLASDRSYEFDIIAVWLDLATGMLFAAHDSGCSCPRPFEGFHGIADLTPILTVDDFERFVAANAPTYDPISMADVFAARRKIGNVLRKTSAMERIKEVQG